MWKQGQDIFLNLSPEKANLKTAVSLHVLLFQSVNHKTWFAVEQQCMRSTKSQDSLPALLLTLGDLKHTISESQFPQT